MVYILFSFVIVIKHISHNNPRTVPIIYTVSIVFLYNHFPRSLHVPASFGTFGSATTVARRSVPISDEAVQWAPWGLCSRWLGLGCTSWWRGCQFYWDWFHHHHHHHRHIITYINVYMRILIVVYLYTLHITMVLAIPKTCKYPADKVIRVVLLYLFQGITV